MLRSSMFLCLGSLVKLIKQLLDTIQLTCFFPKFPLLILTVLLGTNLVERFSDQFNPMLIGQDKAWSLTDSTIIRMPLSSEILKDGLEEGLNRVKQISDQFLEHVSRILIFLKSVSQVLYPHHPGRH